MPRNFCMCLFYASIALCSLPFPCFETEPLRAAPDLMMASSLAAGGSFAEYLLPLCLVLIAALVAFFVGRSSASKKVEPVVERGPSILLITNDEAETSALALSLPQATISGVKNLSDVAAFRMENPDIALVALHPDKLVRFLEDETKKRDYLILGEKMEAMGSLSAGIAHEVANPIGFVTVSTENMQADLENFKTFLFSMMGDDADEEVLESFKNKLIPLSSHLDIILDGCARIRGITRELQAFARCNPGKARKAVVMDLIENMVGLVKTRFKRRATYSVSGDPTAKVFAESAQLNQVFLSLLLNATQSVVRVQEELGNRTPGKIRMNIASHGELVEIQFTDDGPGIPPDELEHVFEAGYTTRQDGGTGMGLTVAKRVIEDHGGRISIKSQVGEGTSVIVVLPMAPLEDPSKKAR